MTYLNKANMHFSNLDFSQAVSEYNKALDADPLLAKAYFFAGWLFFNRENTGDVWRM